MPSPQADSFAAIVVGSGPGGATVARELSRRGKRVLILERGHNRPIKGTTAQCVGYLLVPGKGLLFTNQLLALGRGIITGGSSIAAYATALDPPLEKFRSYGIDLAGELAEARKELPIAFMPRRSWFQPAGSDRRSSCERAAFPKPGMISSSIPLSPSWARSRTSRAARNSPWRPDSAWRTKATL